jgi:hypothetical protein
MTASFPARTSNPLLRSLAICAGLVLASSAAGQTTLPETAELLAFDAQPEDFVGWGVAADGDTLVMSSIEGEGAAYVFVRTGSGWDLQAKLVPVGATHGFGFGGAMALDGDTLVVGAGEEDLQGGAFYVFERTGTTWDAGTRHTIAGASGVGASVDLEGDRMVVGADGSYSSDGAVFVLGRTPTGWVVEQELTAASPWPIERLGWSVALHGDTILAGAPYAGDHGPSSGRAYLFERVDGAWQETALLLPNDSEAQIRFGSTVALEGDVVAVGAPAFDIARPGSVYLFSLTSGGPLEIAELMSPNPSSSDRFGSALALDGGQLVVGAPLAQGGTGSVHVFQRVADLWGISYRLLPLALDPGSRFGLDVAISGADVIVGAPFGDPAGSAFVFDVQPSPTIGFCAATPSAGGLICSMASTGSVSVSENDFTLIAATGPGEARGLFLCGPARAQLPFGDGYLCISPFFPGIFRLQPPVVASPDGVFSRTLDLQDLPTGCVITPGSTWYFQLWFRDAGPVGFHTSNGLAVPFAP